ncbi:uncharacterized protein LOC131207864 [Anopheles bellator]|uniref:uncharacterized protein LOC131207864 n=1 Tax=Anopheles bellator TaxID=139047 RepID=UPI002649C43E|nr:uncharacterized protein LOC131207864 [Anopheles bellator]
MAPLPPPPVARERPHYPRRAHAGLYFHSSPPKVLQMTNQLAAKDNDYRSRDGIVIKPSNIRIWLHHKQMYKLAKVLWAGQGMRLRTETSHHPKMKRFLECVPHVMGVIKDIHQAVIENDLDTLKEKTAPPAPRVILTSKDAHGLTPLHKAAGLAHTQIVEYILSVWPSLSSDEDHAGRTPLHWAASAKNNARSFNLLVQAGADETALDDRHKPAEYYKNKAGDIDRSLLSVIPEAPRISQQGFPSCFDWAMFTLDDDEVAHGGSQTRMKPFLSQNNLLDAGPTDTGLAGDCLSANVVKSKSVQNLTNGVLTDLDAQPELPAGGDKEKPRNGDGQNDTLSDNGMDQTAANDNQQTETAAEPDEQEAADEDGTVVEPVVQSNQEDVGRSAGIVPSTSVNGDGGQDDTAGETISSDTLGSVDRNEDLELPVAVATDVDSERPASGRQSAGIEPNGNSREPSAGAVSPHSSGGSGDEPEDELLKEPAKPEPDRNGSPEGAEEAEVSRDSLEHEAPTAPKDEEIEQDSLGKDGEGDGEPPAISGATKESASGSQSRVTSGKSIRSTSKGDQEEDGRTSRQSSATADQGDTREDDSRSSGHRTRPGSVKESALSDGSRTSTGADSRAVSSRTVVRGSSGKSVATRRSSIVSHKSSHTGTGSIDPSDQAEDSEGNDDSSSTDVQIVSYRTGAENGGMVEPAQSSDGGQVMEQESQESEPDTKPMPEDVPSQVLEIEGTVQGEPDNGQLQSTNHRLVREELEERLNEEQSVQDAIDSADLEKLAAIVLNGKGKSLIGRSADQPEILAFLQNVPAYMGKIRRVHLAAREGSLRDLQSALDRRKFATAKDEISPHGATPLHVATVFGHAGIVRYLAGRFPETLSATDDDGRTPLHYAATLKDNGHFYNLLTHLGANAKVEDNLNHSAEYYLGHVQSQGILSHRQLLRDYGAKEELAEEMLNDQVPDDLHSARRPLDDADTLTTLERCYKIIHEPTDDLLVRSVGLPSNSVPGSASSLRVLITSYLARFLKRSVFDRIKKRQTRLDHNLFDVIWPAMKKATKEKRLDEDLNVGIVMPDYDAFVVFQEFLVPLIKDVHCMEVTQPFMPHPPMQYFPRYAVNDQQLSAPQHPEQPAGGESSTKNGNILRENPDSVRLNLDTSGKYITGCVVECGRNLDAHEFPLNLGIAQLEQVERLVTAKVLSTEFVQVTGESELGTYYSMNEVLENPSEVRTVLAASGLLVPLLDHTDPHQTAESIAINGRYWPYGRGVYVSQAGDLVVWVNVQDHLRLMCCTESKNPAAIGTAYSKVGRAMKFLDERIPFKHSYFLGYLVSRPSFLGTGLKLTLNLALTHLRKERENLRHLCVVRGLHLLTDDGSVRACNMRCLAQTEWQLFQDFAGAVTNIVALEKELSMSNSLHIAATLLRIFQLGEQQVEIPLFRTEEGRYLATSLGDPLIKGLTEVANKRPPDPITYLANYLYNFVNHKTKPQDHKKSLGNDSNNNCIEGQVKQEPAEQDLDSSAQQVGAGPEAGPPPREPSPPPPVAMEPTVRDENAPSPEESDVNQPPADDRDEHGQSILHFACARSHGRNALIQLIEESGVNITYRDELYRTARDVALQATQPENAREIDRYIIGVAAKGDLEALNGMLLEGYDHIVDVVAPDGTTIQEVASTRGHQDVVRFLETARTFEENRENLLSAIREKRFEAVVKLTKSPDGPKLVRAKNYYGRCSLHIAILMENEDIVDYLASNFSAVLKIGDNLQRTPLHYAMGVRNVEAISRILIKNGAKRVLKDLKGRQPTYYFMNKADIYRLQEEERE